MKRSEVVKIKLTNTKPTGRVLDTPITIRVSCGGCSAKVQARSLVEAFGLFLDKKQPKALGVLCEFKTKLWDPVDDTFYMSTEVALEKLGRWSKE